MFRRRAKPKLQHRVADFFWPRMGFRRALAYVGHRIARLPGTPYSIAAGFASGAAISFTPFMGFHFAGGALLAWIVRGNVLASAIGTFVGNPWTFPLIWMASFRLGRWVLGMPVGRMLPEAMGFGFVLHHPWDTLVYIFDHPRELLFPWLLGGTIVGAVAWLAVFFSVRAAVTAYQHRRTHRRTRRGRRREREAEA